MLSIAICLAFLIPVSAVCLVALFYTIVGIGTRVFMARRKSMRMAEAKADPPPQRFVILIPAHNEEKTLPEALKSIEVQDYPRDRFEVLVVADNCTDGTVEIARRFGMRCVERTDAEKPGKGFAIARGVEAISGDDFDQVLMVDADCRLSGNALRELDAEFNRGAVAVQLAVISSNADSGPSGYVAAVGSAVDHAMAAGRGRLGLQIPLRGTGMAFRKEALGLVEWATANPVEDTEYANQLQAAGVRVRYCGLAKVHCEAPPTVSLLMRQRHRWARAGVLASKPCQLAFVAITAALCFLTGAFLWWAASLLVATGFVYLQAMAAVGFRFRRLLFLLAAPGILSRLLVVVLCRWINPGPALWVRTPRVDPV